MLCTYRYTTFLLIKFPNSFRIFLQKFFNYCSSNFDCFHTFHKHWDLCERSQECSSVFISDETSDSNENDGDWTIIVIVAGLVMRGSDDLLFPSSHYFLLSSGWCVQFAFCVCYTWHNMWHLCLFGHVCENGSGMNIITQTWLQLHLDYRMICPFIDMSLLTLIDGLSLHA